MTSSTRRWNGSTGTTTAGCTASSATSHPPSSKPPTTLNQRHSNRSRHQHEAGNEPEAVHLMAGSAGRSGPGGMVGQGAGRAAGGVITQTSPAVPGLKVDGGLRQLLGLQSAGEVSRSE